MKRISIFIIFSFFLAQLQAQTQDSSLWAKDKNELTIASSIYLAPLLGIQSSPNFRPVLLYKHKMKSNKFLRLGIAGSSNYTESELISQISFKDSTMTISSTAKYDDIFRINVGLEKQRLFKRNNRFRSIYGCDITFIYTNKRDQLNGKSYNKKNDIYILNEDRNTWDYKLTKNEKTYGLGLAPFFGVDYRIFNRIYLGGVVNTIMSYNFTKKAVDFNMVYTPTLSFRF
jgi:hypothetical protein